MFRYYKLKQGGALASNVWITIFIHLIYKRSNIITIKKKIFNSERTRHSFKTVGIGSQRLYSTVYYDIGPALHYTTASQLIIILYFTDFQSFFLLKSSDFFIFCISYINSRIAQDMYLSGIKKTKCAKAYINLHCLFLLI